MEMDKVDKQVYICICKTIVDDDDGINIDPLFLSFDFLRVPSGAMGRPTFPTF